MYTTIKPRKNCECCPLSLFFFLKCFIQLGEGTSSRMLIQIIQQLSLNSPEQGNPTPS